MARVRQGLFARMQNNTDPEVPFLGRIPTGELQSIDNPDGVVGPQGLEGGPYGVSGPRGRTFSQGPGTEKRGVGNASGMATTMVTTGRIRK